MCHTFFELDFSERRNLELLCQRVSTEVVITSERPRSLLFETKPEPYTLPWDTRRLGAVFF